MAADLPPEAPEPRKRGRRRRRASRWLGRVLAVLGLVWLLALSTLIGFAYALARGWQPERTRQLIEVSVSELLHRRLEIGALHGSLLSGLRLENVSLAPPTDAGGQPEGQRLSLRALEIQIDLPASLRAERIVIARAFVEGLRIDLSRTRGGVWRLAGWGDLRSEPGSADQAVPRRSHLTLEVSSLELKDCGLALAVETERVDAGFELGVDAGFGGLTWRIDRVPAWPARGLGRLRIESASWNSQRIEPSSLAFESAGRRISLREIRLASPHGHLAGEGGLVFTGPLQRPRLASSDLSVHFEDVDLASLPVRESARSALASRLSGDAVAQLRRRGARQELQLQATLAPTSELAGSDVEQGELRGRVDLVSWEWQVDEASLVIGAGSLSARGAGDRESLSRLEIDSPDLRLSELPEAWRPPGRSIAGRGHLEVRLSGPYADPAGELGLSGSGLRVDGVGPARGELRISALGGRRYRLDTLSLVTEAGARPAEGLRVRATRAASLHVAGDALHVSDLDLVWSGGELSLEGGLQGETLLPTRIHVKSLDLATVATLLARPGTELGGVISGSLDLEGPVRDPRLAARLQWSEPRLTGLAADRIGIDLVSDEQHLAIDARMRRAGRAVLALRADLPKPLQWTEPLRWIEDPASRLDLEAEAFELAWLDPVLSRLSAVEDGSLEGRIDASLHGRGGRPRPQVSGFLLIEDARLALNASEGAARRLGPLNGSLEFTGRGVRSDGLEAGEGPLGVRLAGGVQWADAEELRVAFELTGEGIESAGRLELQGGLEGESLTTIRLRLTGLDAGQLARIAGLPLDLGGQISVELRADGPLARPAAEARLGWQGARIGVITAEQMEVDAELAADGLSARGALTRSGQRRLSARLSFGMDRTGPFSEQLAQLRRPFASPTSRLEVEADDFDLDWLALLLPRLPVKTRGRADGVLVLVGGESEPRLDGVLDIQDGYFSTWGQRTTAGPLHGRLRFEGSRVTVERLALASGRGDANVEGSAGWSLAGLRDVDLVLRLSDFGFDQLGVVRSVLDGELQAKGGLDSLVITGRIALSNVRVAFPSGEDPVLKEIRVLNLPQRSGPTISEGGAEIEGVGARSRVDVTFSLPSGTWVRGLGLDAEVAGDVQVLKLPGEKASYQGVLEVQHGRYSLQGKRFDLERGVAMFAGVGDPIPDLDIRAVRQVSRDVRVTAHVRGPANAPTLELTSEPPMDTAEIISYIYFGRSRADAAEGEANSDRNAALASAFGTVGSTVFNNIAPDLVERLPVDQVTVTSGEDGPAVEIESQITPDIYLRLTQSLGAAADESVEVRYRLLWGFSLKSIVKRSGASGLDLLWSFEFWGLEDYGAGGLRPPPPPWVAPAPPDASGSEPAAAPDAG